MSTIAVDFDGTITADFKAARKALQELKDEGHTIVIWSSRNNPRRYGKESKKLVEGMKEELKHEKIPYDEIDEGGVGKYAADFYIDNKSIEFRNEDDWNHILKHIKKNR